MKKKFTEGDWNVSDDTSECYLVKSDDGGLIAFVYDGDIDDEAIHMDVVQANAKLIAAAPELLDALRTLVNGCLSDSESDKVVSLRKAKEVIKKATE